MADRLQAWKEAAGARNPFANQAALTELQAMLDRETDLANQTQIQFALAQEYLNAGRLHECLLMLTNVMERMYSGRSRMGPSSRMIVQQLHGVALMRLGEMQNCLEHHNPESCLFPIRDQGQHVNPSGSARALEVFERLARRPRDLGSKWLLNVAAMTLGRYPDGIDPSLRLDPSIFASDHPLGRFPEIGSQIGLAMDGLAGATVAEDFDGDGWLDAFVTSWNVDDQSRLFRNQGNGTFVDVTEQAGLIGLTGGLNAMQTDYNNDGHPDIYIVRGAWLEDLGEQPNSLLRNNGDGTFADVTEEVGLLDLTPGLSAAWFDANRDGWLDLFVGNETAKPQRPRPCQLFLNREGKRFEDVASAAGVDLRAFVRGVTAGDYNNDGWQDLYVSVLGGKNRLFRNDAGESGEVRFTDVAATAGVTEPNLSFPTWFWDYDNDGHLDLFVSGYGADLDAFSTGTSGHNTLSEVVADKLGRPTEAEQPRLYRNEGDGTFRDVTKQANLWKAFLTMGASFGDLDNDGYQDLYLGTGIPYFGCLVPNEMYRNDGEGRFQDVTTAGGFGHLQKGHGITFADLNNDGHQEVLANMGGAYPGDNYFDAVFANPGREAHWVVLKLVGKTSNRAGIGARVRVQFEENGRRREVHRAVGSSSSFGTTPLRQEIGLGSAARIERVEVWWPASGQTNVVEGLETDAFYRWKEGENEVERLERSKFAWPKAMAGHGHGKTQHD